MPDETETGDALEVYADGYSVQAHQYTVRLTFTLAIGPEKETRTQVVVRMSPEHAKVMAILFKKNIQEWEEQFGVQIPLPGAVLELHKIDLEKDW